MEPDNLIFDEKSKRNQIKSKNKYKNLKNDYFVQKVFNILQKKISYNILKYNKYIKKRININNSDYKEYSQKYSSIEIEIKPLNNEYGKFINIKKEDEIYYHIYFNNNKEEIERNYIKKDEKIENIKILINNQIKSLENLFYYCNCIESLNFKKFTRNNINNMSYMFTQCSSLKELNLNNFNTNNVTNISYMFYGCLFLK